MAAVKSLTFAEEPLWLSSRTLAAIPGEIEMHLEGPIVHVRAIGSGPQAGRVKQRMGAHFLVGRWDYVVLVDEAIPPKDQPKK